MHLIGRKISVIVSLTFLSPFSHSFFLTSPLFTSSADLSSQSGCQAPRVVDIGGDISMRSPFPRQFPNARTSQTAMAAMVPALRPHSTSGALNSIFSEEDFRANLELLYEELNLSSYAEGGLAEIECAVEEAKAAERQRVYEMDAWLLDSVLGEEMDGYGYQGTVGKPGEGWDVGEIYAPYRNDAFDMSLSDPR